MLIARKCKPHDIRELIIPAVKEVIQTVMGKFRQQIICSNLLSNSYVQRRIDEMASNVLTTLCEKLRTKTFSLEIDESTLPDNQALLPSYVRSIDNEKICQYYSVQILKPTQKVLQFTML